MNKLLSTFPASDRRRLDRKFERATLEFGQTIFAFDEPVSHVYFPVDSLIALLTVVDARRSIAVGMVGNDGMAGLSIVLGAPYSASSAIVLGAGDVLRMEAGAFRAELRENPALQTPLCRYAFALVAQISQTAACSRFHAAEPRLARWLMMTRDRIASDEFRLTHALLAHMLGVRREGITQAANALRQRGLIDYSRGAIRILNAEGLRLATCSCYEALERRLQRA